MKVDHTVKIMGISENTGTVNQTEQDRKKTAGENGKIKAKNGSVNAAGLTLFDDNIANKKQKARKEAMELIKSQFKADGKIDTALEATRARSEESKATAKEAQAGINAVEEEKQALKEAYGEDSEIYKEQAAVYDKQLSQYKETKDKANKDIAWQTGLIRNTKQELLKYHGMADAVKAAEETLKASSKEIMGLLMEEVKDKIDQDMEDTIKEAQDKKEESQVQLEKEQQEKKKKAEEVEEKGEELHKEAQNSRGKRNPEDMEDVLEEVQNSANAKIDKILMEEALISDDLKGAAVDTLL